MILATLNTGNYQFVVVAGSRIRARRALRTALNKHAEQTGADPSFLVQALDEWVEYTDITLDQVLRDGAPL